MKLLTIPAGGPRSALVVRGRTTSGRAEVRGFWFAGAAGDTPPPYIMFLAAAPGNRNPGFSARELVDLVGVQNAELAPALGCWVRFDLRLWLQCPGAGDRLPVRRPGIDGGFAAQGTLVKQATAFLLACLGLSAVGVGADRAAASLHGAQAFSNANGLVDAGTASR